MKRAIAFILVMGLTFCQGAELCLASGVSTEAVGQVSGGTEDSVSQDMPDTETPEDKAGAENAGALPEEEEPGMNEADNTNPGSDGTEAAVNTEMPSGTESPEGTGTQENTEQITPSGNTESTETAGTPSGSTEAADSEEPAEPSGNTESAETAGTPSGSTEAADSEEPAEPSGSTEAADSEGPAGTNQNMAPVLPEQEAVTAETEEELPVFEEEARVLMEGQSVITVQAANGADIAQALDDALEQARDTATAEAPVTVRVPAGSYTLSSRSRIYSNTILDCTGVTFKYTGATGNMLMLGTNGSYKGQDNYNMSEACKGYGGFENITVRGGVWEGNKSNTGTLIRLAHATNVTLEGVSLVGGGCAHQIEVAAIDGFYVRNCTFRDFGVSRADDPDKQEALQLDIACSSDVFKDIYEDGSVMKNVEITGCTFANVPRGVGTHTMLHGAYHENIKINGNTFTNVTEEAIVGLNYYNCEIKDNKITDCGAGILFQFFKSADKTTGNTPSVYTTIFDGQTPYSGTVRHDANTVISGNKISTKYAPTCDEIQGIWVYGVNLTKSSKGGDGKTLPKGDYYISNVTVTGNTITTAGHGIHLTNARNCPVSGNSISGRGADAKDSNADKYDGIMIANGSAGGEVTNNTISSMPRNGIFVMEEAGATAVSGNTITDCTWAGVNVFDKSSVAGGITSNTITGAKHGGVMISTDSTTGDISGNTITSVSGEAGITVFKKSTTGSISNNTITDMGKEDGGNKYCHGIKLTTDATCGSISDNRILKNTGAYAAANGILLFSGSAASGSITGNTIGKTADIALSVSTNSKVGGEISGNKITDTAKSAIFVYKSSSVGGDIKNNTISNAKESGIYLTGDVKVKGSVSSNTITSVGGKGIYVYNKSTVKNIQKNTIKKAKSQGINLASMKNKITISGNKISSGSDIGIIIQPGSTKYVATVNKNTIAGNNKTSGIRIINGNVSIADNKISKVNIAVFASKGVKGSIYTNDYGSKVKVKVRVEKVGDPAMKPVNVKRAKSSAKKKATVSWTKVWGVTGYEIQCSTKKNFSSGIKSATVKKNTGSGTVTKLTSGKTYYVRVRSYQKCGSVNVYSDFGKTKTVKVK